MHTGKMEQCGLPCIVYICTPREHLAQFSVALVHQQTLLCMVANSSCVLCGTIYAHTHTKKEAGGRKRLHFGGEAQVPPWTGWDPIWAPINLPPKMRAYKWFDILGNKLIASK